MLGRLGTLAIAIGLAASPAAAADLVLERAADYLVPVEINGIVLRLRADPAASGLVILNPGAVRRAKIQPELIRGRPGIPGLYIRESLARVGPVRLAGRTRALAGRIGGAIVPLRAIWFDRDAIDGADGLISVALLPYDSVSFRLRPARGDESESALALEFVTELGLYHPWPLGERAIPIQFSLWRPASIGTAAAGALLARDRAGAWQGGLERRPLSFGIVRPVRPLLLARPIELGRLSVRRFLVRTGDYRGGYALPRDSDLDPDEIVVTAERAVQAARLNLILGQDQFGACSSLRFERAPRRLVLSCAVNPPRGSAPGAPRAPIAGTIGRAPAPRLPPGSGW
ncbi:MAG TPA: hypothetical protein VGW40_02425 [Allosphingosinicella sp.]|nr:hypothetical protein [Allosphingosinicella sp.]